MGAAGGSPGNKVTTFFLHGGGAPLWGVSDRKKGLVPIKVSSKCFNAIPELYKGDA